MRSVLTPSRSLQYAASIALLSGSSSVSISGVEAAAAAAGAKDLAASPLLAEESQVKGYGYGQEIPITCLERDLNTGEHVTDASGFLSWVPFLTCNETNKPLALKYGVSETINCTLDSLSDELYHMLEFYVHHDVPLSCRIPSLPLDQTQKQTDGSKKGDVSSGEGGANSAGTSTDLLKEPSGHPPYTPLTIALQGTLQLSHLHMWTDMNVLAHHGQYPIRTLSTEGKAPSSKSKKEEKKKKKQEKKKNKKKGKKKNQEPGQIIAATAYSLPFVKPNPNSLQQPQTHDLWAPGQGTKVIRGEPLPLTFRVYWTEDDDLLESVSASHAPNIAAKLQPAGSPQRHEVLSTMIYLIIAALVGAVIAIWWERNVGSGKVRWKGEGILGHPSKSSPNMGFFHSDGKVSIGTRGAMNGYGGYGGYANGKRD